MRGGRNTALICLAGDLPAPVLAGLLCLSSTTGVRWTRYAQTRLGKLPRRPSSRGGSAQACGIGTASLLADVGHEVPTARLPSLRTSTLRAPADALGVIEGEPRCEGWNPRLRSTPSTRQVIRTAG